jgi:uracil-DNA glycosylase
MDNRAFINYLTKYFGNKVLNVLEETEKGISINSSKIEAYNIANAKTIDKCTDCIATKYRQDLPFWITNYSNKKIMVIAQDAGKGIEDKKINTVFDMHSFHLNEEKYISKHRTHYKYVDLFRKITGKNNFLDDIYFTDIIKCAFSSDKSIKSNSCLCSNDIVQEINLVNPASIVLMGNQAKSAFTNLMSQNKIDLKLIEASSTPINSKQSIKFYHMKTERFNVFFMPHFAGNLHVSNDFKDSFNNFKDKCCYYIHQYND